MPEKYFGRILSSNADIENFIKNVIHLDEDEDFEGQFNDCVFKIIAAEMQINTVKNKDTLTHTDYRIGDFSSEEQRKKLRKQIYQELIENIRLDNDDKITMGNGGALPQTELKSNREAYLVIGLPASGKSEISNLLSDKYGAMILDSDYAKRKFPEFNAPYGATVVHEESGIVVFGGNVKYAKESSVLEYAIKHGHNIVIPKIGDVKSKIYEFAKNLNLLGYKVHLILVRLDREKATKRAFKRFVNTGRYVPLPLVFDVYSNDPTITFYDLYHNNEYFESFTMLSSDVPVNNPKIKILSTDKSPL